MKLMFENSEISFEQELTEGLEKKYRIKGIFSTPEKQNKNGRIYPMSVWEREVAKYQDVLKSGHPNSLMELEHPPRSQVDMMEAVARIEKLYIENGYVMGEAVLLDNPKANQLKTLIDNGIKMSVSSRGVGSVKGNIVENYNLVNFDVIANLGQSDHSAEMYGIVEGVLRDKNFLITESGEIKEVTLIPEKEEIQEAKVELTLEEKKIAAERFMSKFSEILGKSSNSSVNEGLSGASEWVLIYPEEKLVYSFSDKTLRNNNDAIKWKIANNIKLGNLHEYNKGMESSFLSKYKTIDFDKVKELERKYKPEPLSDYEKWLETYRP